MVDRTDQSPNTSMFDGVAACPLAPQLLLPAPEDPPCDVSLLKIESEKIATLQANHRLRDQPIPPEAPTRIRPALGSYDLVMELIAPTVRAFAKAQKKEATKVNISANWAPHCEKTNHQNALFVPETIAGDTLQKPSMNVVVYCQDWIAAVRNPATFFSDLFQHARYAARYSVEADSCGLRPAGTAVQTLKALIITQPADAWGLKIEIKLLPFHLGLNAENKEKAEKAREEERRELERKTEISGRRYKSERREARNRLKETETDDRRISTRVQRFLSDPWAPEKEKDRIDCTLILNDREIKLSEVGAAFSQAKSGRSDVAKIHEEIIFDAAAVAIIFAALRGNIERIQKAITFIWKYSPSLVQPELGLEISFFELAASGISKYGLDKTSARFTTVERKCAISGDITLIDAKGTGAVVLGKKLVGTGVEIIGCVTLEGEIKGSIEAEIDSLNSWEANWQRVKKGAKVEGKLSLTGSASVEASLLFADIACAGAQVTGSITAEPKVESGRINCELHRDEVVLTAHWHLCWLPWGPPYRRVLIERGPTPGASVSVSGGD